MLSRKSYKKILRGENAVVELENKGKKKENGQQASIKHIDKYR